MKKGIILMFFVLLLSVALVSAQEPPIRLEPVEPMECWCCSGFCKQLVNLVNQTNQHLDNIFNLLGGDILTTLEEIRDKNDTVVVLPEEECEWETYAQLTNFELTGFGSTYLPVPQNIPSEEINVTSAYAYFKWQTSGGDKCTILVNGVQCVSKQYTSGGEYIMQSFNPSCLSAFHSGLNTIQTSYIGGCNTAEMKDLMVEMQVKQANC